MKAETGTSVSWSATSLWPMPRISPYVVVLSGIDGSEIVNAALGDPALTEIALPRLEPACTPPCDALLWRVETASGAGLNQPRLLRNYWHRRPYAMTIRLVQYQPGSETPEILDEATLGTRGEWDVFKAAADRLAMRFVRDAALGRGRGAAVVSPAAAPYGAPGWMDAIWARWTQRLTVEWWSVGSATASLNSVLLGGGIGEITWYHAEAGVRYLADPFPWPGTSRILCEEMPLIDGVGRIVAITPENGTLLPSEVILDDGAHHSYPCTFREDDLVHCVPESTLRGATRIYRLHDDGRLVPVCDPAPYARLADPTLFRWNGRYWLGCTDLDLGEHDNLCLLHAPAITGPWTQHSQWPVRIDVRGARCAGMMFNVEGRLFRPGQDCAATYGAAVVLHEIVTLTETEFRETPVTTLFPDQSGPFPHGLHTLVHDGQRFWVDGKRFVIDFGVFRAKLLGKASRVFSRLGGK